ADLEHAVSWLHPELLGHIGDHIRLAYGLAAVDRQRLIGIGPLGQRLLDEMFPWNLVECPQHRGVHDSALAHAEQKLHAADTIVAQGWFLHAQPLSGRRKWAAEPRIIKAGTGATIQSFGIAGGRAKKVGIGGNSHIAVGAAILLSESSPQRIVIGIAMDVVVNAGGAEPRERRAINELSRKSRSAGARDARLRRRRRGDDPHAA